MEDNNMSFANSDSISFDDKKIKQSIVVLNQTLSALTGVKFKKVAIHTGDSVLVFIEDNNSIIGYLGKNEVDNKLLISSLNKIGTEVVEEKEVKVVEEEIIQQPVEKEVEKLKEYSSNVLTTINSFAEDYLEDFAYDIIENIKTEMDISNKDVHKSDIVMKYIKNIEKAASMIIGPTRANEMKNKMVDALM
ncbi:hypothetical protein KAU43_02760 [candidate division WOR-3 bacterium]|nr:hypothetical protein [candidate division WOR-3 bacterium]